jgi:hypothetical protein
MNKPPIQRPAPEERARILGRQLGFQLAYLLRPFFSWYRRQPQLTKDEQAQIERIISKRFPQ